MSIKLKLIIENPYNSISINMRKKFDFRNTPSVNMLQVAVKPNNITNAA